MTAKELIKQVQLAIEKNEASSFIPELLAMIEKQEQEILYWKEKFEKAMGLVK